MSFDATSSDASSLPNDKPKDKHFNLDAPVKSEYLINRENPNKKRQFDEINYDGTDNPSTLDDDAEDQKGDEVKDTESKGGKKGRLSIREARKQKKKDRKDRLCPSIIIGKECKFGEKCIFSHDIESFLQKKPQDLSESCPFFERKGFCPFGIACRCSSKHVKDGKNTVDEELMKKNEGVEVEFNVLKDELQRKLTRKTYQFEKSASPIRTFRQEKKLRIEANKSQSKSFQQNQSEIVQKSEENTEVDKNEIKENQEKKEEEKEVGKKEEEKEEVTNEKEEDKKKNLEERNEEKEVKIRIEERRKIDFKGKLYLAPLTTVGNLPFRRMCKKLGADITCGEMALGFNLINGQQSEWALLKRHSSEDLFGVQVCGSNMELLTKTAELISDNLDRVDFIDVNMGCPIDLIYNQGAGSALLEHPRSIQDILGGMNKVMNPNISLTIKVRTGKDENKPTIHKHFPFFESWGACAVTIHGRSRQQRYSRLANWEYINQCAKLTDLPVLGNGDIFSYTDYYNHMENSSLSSVMIARGALIKPWIFTEIKERRHWDISSNERLGFIKDFANYGLDHWGSDQLGVEKTRRFLLEWMSFTHRYVPVGLLEVLPPVLNQRAPAMFGRDDLETRMLSSDPKEWIKLSSMFLGEPPSGFSFAAKHKASG